MMAEKSRLFQDHRVVELIVVSSDPRKHKRAGRGVRNFDTVAWNREKQHAVLSGNYAKCTQNPAIKVHLLSTGHKRLAEASPLDLEVSGRTAPALRIHRSEEENPCSVRHSLPFAKQFATARPDRHTWLPLVDSVAPPEILESTKYRLLSSRA